MAETNKLGMRALYYIALARDVDGNGENDGNESSDPQKIQWLKSNQNRLNQNFSIISGEIEAMAQRLEELERK